MFVSYSYVIGIATPRSASSFARRSISSLARALAFVSHASISLFRVYTKI